MFFKLEKEKLENRRRARRALMVPEEGLEPSRTCVRQILSLLQRAKGIEPSWPAWKAGTLPLSYARTGKRGKVYQNCFH